MKAAIYCRLSREDPMAEGESESIQNQKSMLIQYAIAQGFEIYQIYSDEDYSGADSSRPAFNEMLRAASEHRFEVVIAKTQSRFTRDMELVERYLHGKFPEWGIRFIAVLDHADTDDRYNKKARQINGLINEWYLEDLSENIRSVMKHKQKSGQFIGSFAPYGYAKDPQDHNHLVIDPEAAQVVRRIFRLALEGWGCEAIAAALNEDGIPNPTRYKQLQGCKVHTTAQGLWGAPTVGLILRREAYIGNLVQGVHRKVSYKSKTIRTLPRSQWSVVPGTHEPIVSRLDFELVQRMRRAGRAPGGGETPCALAGLVRCGCCGSVMQVCGSRRGDWSGDGVRDFRCPLHRREPEACVPNSVQAAPLEALILEKLRQYGEQDTPQTLTRGLAFLLIDGIRVWPRSKGQPRRVEILWRF